MPQLKPAYLIHGDDHGAVAERRAGLRALAEREGGAESVESLEGEVATPEGVAGALAAMTLTIGRRVILVEGVERWKEKEVKETLAPAMEQMPPDTTVALFAREEGRSKAPKAVHEAVKQAKGQVVAQGTVKPWELPKWARAQAAKMGIEMDMAAAKALVAQVGERQQRLLRELEKIALEAQAPPNGAAIEIGAEQIEARAARSAQHRAYTLADALVGADARAAMRTYVRLRSQGERLAGLTYLMASRMREALAIATRLQAGESPAEVRRGLRMPPKAAERLLADVSRSDPGRLRDAIGDLADLEVDTRGGSPLPEARSGRSGLHEETLAVRAIQRITAG